MHFTSILNRNMMKANNIPSPAHPVRPSRIKKSNSPPPNNTGFINISICVSNK